MHVAFTSNPTILLLEEMAKDYSSFSATLSKRGRKLKKLYKSTLTLQENSSIYLKRNCPKW